jgi:predicted transcriptional regulator
MLIWWCGVANAEARELAAKREAQLALEKDMQESKYEEMLKAMGEQAALAQRRVGLQLTVLYTVWATCLMSCC